VAGTAETLETLAWGYGLIEGPRVDPDDNLYFSDVRKGGVYQRRPDGTIDTVVPKRRGVGGIALHADGGLVMSGRDICHVKDGTSRTLLNLEVPGYNDLVADSAGRVLVGTLRSDPFADASERVTGECWRIEAEGRATELYGGVALTNGIGFSPDGSVLYHADTANHGLWAHDVDEAGAVSNRRFLVQRDDFQPDGIAVDAEGVVWAADFGGGAVRGFSPTGDEVGRIEVPATLITSVCFGGADLRDVYIVTADNSDDPSRQGTIFRTRAAVAGVPVPRVTI
jgi:xylono-1,5-lactonase